MIHHHIDTLNNLLFNTLPTKCDVQVWTSELKGLAKQVWHNEDKNRYLFDGSKDFFVRNDKLNLQACHIIERIRKRPVDFGAPVYTIECSWLGIGTTMTAGLLAMSVFQEIENLNISVTDFDNNTERVLTTYWGMKRDDFGQNPEYNAWRISYNYTLANLDRDDLLELEGLTDLD